MFLCVFVSFSDAKVYIIISFTLPWSLGCLISASMVLTAFVSSSTYQIFVSLCQCFQIVVLNQYPPLLCHSDLLQPTGCKQIWLLDSKSMIFVYLLSVRVRSISISRLCKRDKLFLIFCNEGNLCWESLGLYIILFCAGLVENEAICWYVNVKVDCGATQKKI